MTKTFKNMISHTLTWKLVKIYQIKLSTVGLNQSGTVKKMTAKYDNIFSTYEHSWVGPKWFFFQTLFGHQRALQSFFSKLEFWAENFFGHSFYDKNWFYGSVNLLFVQKWVKMAKRSHLQYFSSFIKNLKMSKILKIWSI